MLIAMLPSLLMALFLVWRMGALSPKRPRPEILLVIVMGIALTALYVKGLANARLSFIPSDLSSMELKDALFIATFLAALPEELLKGMALFIAWVLTKKRVRRFSDIITLSVGAAIGFALAENYLYLMPGLVLPKIQSAISPTELSFNRVFAMLIHCYMGLVAGFFWARAGFLRSQRAWNTLLALALPMLFHAAIDIVPLMMFKTLSDHATALLTTVQIHFFLVLFGGCFFIIDRWEGEAPPVRTPGEVPREVQWIFFGDWILTTATLARTIQTGQWIEVSVISAIIALAFTWVTLTGLRRGRNWSRRLMLTTVPLSLVLILNWRNLPPLDKILDLTNFLFYGWMTVWLFSAEAKRFFRVKVSRASETRETPTLAI